MFNSNAHAHSWSDCVEDVKFLTQVLLQVHCYVKGGGRNYSFVCTTIIISDVKLLTQVPVQVHYYIKFCLYNNHHL